jgi:hypothetical protein
MKTKIAALVLGLATLGGVARAQSAQARLAVATTDDPPANTVTVQNDRKTPVTIYLEYGVFDRRLGNVPALQTATLPLPSWMVNARERVQLVAEPEKGAGDFVTQWFSLEPPGRIGMVVAPPGGLPPEPGDTMLAVIPPEELADATLTVENPRKMAVTVFAELPDMDGLDVRLGKVPAHGSATLRFPKSVVGPNNAIRVFVHPDGGFDLSSQIMEVRRGEHLGLRVPAH